ncbi:adenylate/guanylate cyclase domain-containing protein [Microvirga lotononidis]|uniref:Family 3 adenylate cyclase n=1 Tax=Microvirga lotononidis TaxID=864069 RepID=I4YQH8_9HYPH|nr:adenylate/guanylate cyclase domain-containing protein [Microvirga lotononidis]EIM26220.1 family 3 adenylate cyclase [Microvirga lotononidis]WQO30608.1 adenylate/guanylate cyclase domain-containing protein [Microvirga lotononidis]
MPHQRFSDLDVLKFATWLVGTARVFLSPVEIVAQACERLTGAGIPLWRVRVGQRLINPLIGAWGVIWMRETGAEEYTVPRSVLATGAFTGSPFEHVIRTRTRFYRSLRDLDPIRDHPVLFELAADGSTDYLALPIVYGDGSVQGAAFTTDAPDGFSQAATALIEDLSPFIAAALEPAAMRRSAESLLRTYLGDGPAQRIAAGAIRRGDQIAIEAAVLLTDLRGYTLLSEQLPPHELLERLGQYQEIVVTAVRAEGGDVLKFMGDGVLSIFPVEGSGLEKASGRARRALEAALLQAEQIADLRFVGCLHAGSVIYGNIGSPDRLDFTVVGPTVNFVCRLEAVAKNANCVAVCSREVAACFPAATTRWLGTFTLPGIPDAQAVFELATPSRGLGAD